MFQKYHPVNYFQFDLVGCQKCVEYTEFEYKVFPKYLQKYWFFLTSSTPCVWEYKRFRIHVYINYFLKIWQVITPAVLRKHPVLWWNICKINKKVKKTFAYHYGCEFFSNFLLESTIFLQIWYYGKTLDIILCISFTTTNTTIKSIINVQ